MAKCFAVLLIFILGTNPCDGAKDNKCSKLDFEEKVLEKVVRIEHKMEINTETVNELSKLVKDDTSKMKEEFDVLKRELIEREKMLNDTIHKTNTDLAAQIPQSYYTFSVHNLSVLTPQRGDTLVFTHTLVNDNGVYSNTTGKFTAPCDGVYVFYATLASGINQKYVRVEFKAGEISIGMFTILDYYYGYITSSATAIARLMKGTQVYIRVTGVSPGFKFRVDDFEFMSTFSGHLISK